MAKGLAHHSESRIQAQSSTTRESGAPRETTSQSMAHSLYPTSAVGHVQALGRMSFWQFRAAYSQLPATARSMSTQSTTSGTR